jgi:hypothetical protein
MQRLSWTASSSKRPSRARRPNNLDSRLRCSRPSFPSSCNKATSLPTFSHAPVVSADWPDVAVPDQGMHLSSPICATVLLTLPWKPEPNVLVLSCARSVAFIAQLPASGSSCWVQRVSAAASCAFGRVR